LAKAPYPRGSPAFSACGIPLFPGLTPPNWCLPRRKPGHDWRRRQFRPAAPPRTNASRRERVSGAATLGQGDAQLDGQARVPQGAGSFSPAASGRSPVCSPASPPVSCGPGPEGRWRFFPATPGLRQVRSVRAAAGAPAASAINLRSPRPGLTCCGPGTRNHLSDCCAGHRKAGCCGAASLA